MPASSVFLKFTINNHQLTSQHTYFKGDLGNGVVIHDLSWARKSSVACFPAYSRMEITVIPDGTDANFCIYVDQVGVNSKALVPKLH